MTALLLQAHSLLVQVLLEDPAPADKDVKAGWGAFWIFIGLILAVALLGWSLVRQLKKTRTNADAGVFGDDADRDESQD